MTSATSTIRNDGDDVNDVHDDSDRGVKQLQDPSGSTQKEKAEMATTDKPFSIFTSREKWTIVWLSGISALFSPLTANIYFPAIPTIATAFNKPVELINLTVTVYMIMQGVSPMFWGTIADRKGRRPIYMGCLLILSLSCAGLALVPTSDYWLLMLLRCIQAAGSASTVALGAGTIVDISTRAERGTYLGVFSLGPMVGPCIGPVLGGLLAGSLGWRAIFWFICITSAVWLIAIFLIMPETLRALVGDGSIPAPRWDRPLIPLIGRKQRRNNTLTSADRPAPEPFRNPFGIFRNPDVVILLVYNAIIYAVFYTVITTISTLFQVEYPFLSEIDVGLCFLAVGGGMILGSVLTGKLLDMDYQAMKTARQRAAGHDVEQPLSQGREAPDDSFPIEKARLRTMPIYLSIIVGSLVAYGWFLEKRVNLAGPLVLLIIIGWCTMAFMNSTQTLIMDLFPTHGAAITACNNLVRCSSGAALVSVIDLILNALGTGWTFVLMAGVCVLFSPMMYIETHMGPIWRERRRKRESEHGNK